MNYLFLAMKRSGHHAIMNWVQAHTKQPIYNNTCHGWGWGRLLTMVGRKEAIDGIANIEDFNPDDWDTYNFPSFPFLKESRVIMVMRSANNWLASCYKRKFQHNEERKDVYKYLDKSFINDRKEHTPSRIDLYCMQLEFAVQGKTVNISFDDWFRYKNTRKWLAEQLNIEFNDEIDKKAVNTVANYGNGSSFDGISHDGNAQKMDVLNRDKKFLNDKEYKLLVSKAFPKMMDTLKKVKAKL